MFIVFLLSSAVMFFLNCMLNILKYDVKKCFLKLMSRLLHSTIHKVMWYFWVFTVNPLSLLWSIFFSQENFVLFGLLISCLLLSQSASILLVNETCCGVFLKITSPFWIILSVSLDEPNSIDWSLKSWFEFSWNNFYFIVVKEFWYGKKR